MIVGSPVGASREAIESSTWAQPPRSLISIVATVIVVGPVGASRQLGLTDFHNSSQPEMVK